MPGSGGAALDPGAGPYQLDNDAPRPAAPISPVEMLLALLERDLDKGICPYVCVGPAEHPMQQAGVASLTQAGANQTNPHMPLVWTRVQVRCIGHTMSHSEQIGMHVFETLHTRHRELVRQPSTGASYLIHNIQCTVNPSNHYDGVATWESLAFYQVLVGTTPASTS